MAQSSPEDRGWRHAPFGVRSKLLGQTSGAKWIHQARASMATNVLGVAGTEKTRIQIANKINAL